MNHVNIQQIDADRPLKAIEKDLLGVSTQAKYIADGILSMDASEGLIISIEGAWGSGKTTFINFILQFLKKSPEVTVIEFNPWWFNNRDHLAFYFFQEVATRIGANGDKKFRKIASLMRDASKLIGAFEIPAASVAHEFFGAIAAVPEKDLISTKEELETNLRKLGKRRIVIVIDDLDRLTREEILQLFPLIKGVSNLPNVIYVLAFDRVVLSRLLGNDLDNQGSSYIDKIVQLPLQLPAVSRPALRRLLVEEIKKIVECSDKQLSHDPGPLTREDGDKLLDWILPGITTIRDVKRLTNSLRVYYPVVKHEVNVWHFVAIEAIRLFEPELYSYLKNNRYRLVQNLALTDEDEAMPSSRYNELARKLFPTLSPPRGLTFRRSGRDIHDATYVDVYFRYSLGEHQFPSSKLDEFIGVASQLDDLRLVVENYFKRNPQHLAYALKELTYRVYSLSSDETYNFLHSFVEVEPIVLKVTDNYKSEIMTEFSNFFNMIVIVKEMQISEKYELVRKLIAGVEKSAYFPLMLLHGIKAYELIQVPKFQHLDVELSYDAAIRRLILSEEPDDHKISNLSRLVSDNLANHLMRHTKVSDDVKRWLERRKPSIDIPPSEC